MQIYKKTIKNKILVSLWVYIFFHVRTCINRLVHLLMQVPNMHWSKSASSFRVLQAISFSVSVSQFESSNIFSNSTLTNSKNYLPLHLRGYKHWQSSEYKFTHNKMKTIIYWWKWEISIEIQKKKKITENHKIFYQ